MMSSVCDEYNRNGQDVGPDSDDDDHLDSPHLHLGHAAFRLKGVKVRGQREHHIALSYSHLDHNLEFIFDDGDLGDHHAHDHDHVDDKLSKSLRLPQID